MEFPARANRAFRETKCGAELFIPEFCNYESRKAGGRQEGREGRKLAWNLYDLQVKTK